MAFPSLCFKSKPSILVPIFFLLLASLSQTSHGFSRFDRRLPLATSYRRPFKSNTIPSCDELISLSQCSQNSKCSWCRSQDVDDMCFSKTEARKLPQEVFSCN